MTGIPTGIAGATGIDSGLARGDTKANLDAAGAQFEAVFTGMMLKSMRQARLADPLFQSQAADTFRDMQDQRLVQAMATHTPLGIGRAMTEFLGRAQPQDARAQPEVAAAQPDVNADGRSAGG